MTALIRSVALAIAFSAVGFPLAAQATVEGRRLRSDSLPRADFVFDSTLTYLGTQTFTLYDVARAEQHFWGELEGKRLKRFVWLQLEGYLPDNEHTYNYSRFPTTVISGKSFHHNDAIRRNDGQRPRPGSDGERMLGFLAERGYTLGDVVAYQRLVWLLDQPARHEVMIIYMEDLSGVPEAEWESRRAGLLARASAVVTIRDR
jgi:hypothetical protein